MHNISKTIANLQKNNFIFELSAPKLSLNRFHLACQKFFVGLCYLGKIKFLFLLKLIKKFRLKKTKIFKIYLKDGQENNKYKVSSYQ